MNELKKELLQTEAWLPNLGLMGVLDALEELKEETKKFRAESN